MKCSLRVRVAPLVRNGTTIPGSANALLTRLCEGREGEIAVLAVDSAFAEVANRLACLRGISTLTVFALAVEIGDWIWLGGRCIGAYLGLVPSESASGKSRS